MPLTADTLKTALDNAETVHCDSSDWVVIHNYCDEYTLRHVASGNTQRLTASEIDAAPQRFYIGEAAPKLTIDDIKAAVDQGRRVHWASLAYEVIRDKLGQYLVLCNQNGCCWGLTNRAGDKLNGRPEQFFILR